MTDDVLPTDGALPLDQLKRKAKRLLRSGDFSLAERLLERGDASFAELTENLRVYQAELEAQAAELRESQLRLEQALHRFQRLFAGLPLPAIVTDPLGFMLRTNVQAERQFGLGGIRAANTPVFRLLEDDSARRLLQVGYQRAESAGHASVPGLRFATAGQGAAVFDAFIERLDAPAANDASWQFVILLVDQTERIAGEAALKASNERLRRQQHENLHLAAVARETSNLVVLTDAQQHITWVNAAFTRVTGYALEDVQGRRPGEVLQGAGTDPAVVALLHERLARGEAVHGVEVLNYTRAGDVYWVLMSIIPIRDPAGRIEQWLAVQTDITARKRGEAELRRNEELQRAVFDAAPASVVLLRPDGTVDRVNAAAAALFQLDAPADAAGRAWTDFAAAEDRAALAALHAAAMRGETRQARLTLAGALGRRWPVNLHAAPLWRGGSVAGVVAFGSVSEAGRG